MRGGRRRLAKIIASLNGRYSEMAFLAEEPLNSDGEVIYI